MKLESECLLSEPGSVPPGDKFDRQSTQVLPDEKLDPSRIPRQFSRQYCHTYAVRLLTIRPKLEEVVKSDWKEVELKKIAELCEFSQANNASLSQTGSKNGSKPSRKSNDHGQQISFREGVTVAIIGTVFKHQPEKPSILQELSEDNPMVPTVPKTKYTSDKDSIQLEDETTRVQLVFSANSGGASVGNLVNGVICAVKGRPTINGKFEVADVAYPTPGPKPALSIKMEFEMVFVSGLEFGSKNSAFQADLLFDYLQGLSGCPSDVELNIKNKSKVFIVGDTFAKKEEDEKDHASAAAVVARKVDRMLDEILQTMDVLILPGENDPARPMLPQNPFHRSIFAQSSRRPTFKALSNPTRVNIPSSDTKTSLEIILSSGQNVTDVVRNADTENPLEAAQNLLRWGHLCPTAPDTLPLHPGVEEDVFFVNELPHVFVVGNQSKFDAMEWKGTKIVTLPKFAQTGIAVLMNKDLELFPINFQVL